jgi:NhaP-type Na+/H+ and K+/H+ antiporter
VLLCAPVGRRETLDRTFGQRAARAALEAGSELTFSIGGEAPAGQVAELYGFHVPRAEAGDAIGAFVGRYLARSARPGARLRVGQVDIVVRRTEGERVTRIDVDLEPGRSFSRWLDLVRVPLLRLGRALLRGCRRLLGRLARVHVPLLRLGRALLDGGRRLLRRSRRSRQA